MKLVKIFDLREVDEWTGEKIALEKGQGNICARCGREHAKVYVVQDTENNKEYYVGSTCCKKMFGWEPEKEEVKRLSKVAKQEAEARAKQRLQKIAQPLVEQITMLPAPKIIVLETQEGQLPQTIWGTANSKAKVWGLTRDGLTRELRESFQRSWRREQVEMSLEQYPREARNKLQAVMMEMLTA